MITVLLSSSERRELLKKNIRVIEAKIKKCYTKELKLELVDAYDALGDYYRDKGDKDSSIYWFARASNLRTMR